MSYQIIQKQGRTYFVPERADVSAEDSTTTLERMADYVLEGAGAVLKNRYGPVTTC